MKTIVTAHRRALVLSILLAVAAGWTPLTATATEPANWLPAPAEPYYLIIRYYSPRAPLLTGDWMPPMLIAR